MKLPIFIVFLIGMAGCTLPQAPVVQGTTIAGLSIPDTVDFGIVRAGLSKTLSVAFQNTGSDSIHITSQTISDSFFQEDPRWKQFNIAPDSSRIVNITYIPHDSIDIAFDTLRSGSAMNIITLRGREIPFSSGFSSAPKGITISLTGVIGAPYGLPNTYSYNYDEPYDLSHSHDSIYYFSGGTSGGDYDQRHDEVDQWSSFTEVPVTIDTNLIIKLLTVRYDYSYGERSGLSFSRSEGLKLHNISLTKNGNIYTSVASGPSLRSVIDTAYIQCDGCFYPAPGMDNSENPMNFLIGFTDSAKLSITIK